LGKFTTVKDGVARSSTQLNQPAAAANVTYIGNKVLKILTFAIWSSLVDRLATIADGKVMLRPVSSGFDFWALGEMSTTVEEYLQENNIKKHTLNY
jgi:hypothetical protein